MSRELLSGVGGRLEIELSEPPERITPTLVNERATPTATILSVHLDAYVFEDGDLRPLRDEELSRVELKRPRPKKGSSTSTGVPETPEPQL